MKQAGGKYMEVESAPPPLVFGQIAHTKQLTGHSFVYRNFEVVTLFTPQVEEYFIILSSTK